MTKEQQLWYQRYRIFFVIAGLWNISAGIGALFMPIFHRSLFFSKAVEAPGFIGQLNSHSFWICVLFFGIGSLIVAYRPDKNHGILWMAGFGKTYFFGLWTWYFLQGKITSFALAGAIGDLIFAFLFFGFFVHFKRIGFSEQ